MFIRKRLRGPALAALMLLAAMVPAVAFAAPAWLPSPNGAFYLKVNSPLGGLTIGQGESIRLRFEVKGSNPAEKFAVFATPSSITDYYAVCKENILEEYAGVTIQNDSNQLPGSCSLFLDFTVHLSPGDYNLWVQYYNGNDVSQTAHTYVPLNVSGPAAWDDSGGQRYLVRSGEKLKGLQYFQGNYCYLNPSTGEVARGWHNAEGQWRYFDGSGMMQTGWIKDPGTGAWYFAEPSGAMLTGWQIINGHWYLLSGNGGTVGAMLTGWQKVGNSWYYLDGGGVMLTGWVKDKGKWYYMNESGAMLTGWQKVGSSWYYLNGSGVMQTGWQKLGGTWYYMNGSGAMQTGTRNINGVTYTFSGSGAWIS